MDPQSFAGRGRNNNFNNNAASPGGTAAAGGGARRTTQPLRPVTIKMLNDAQHVGDGVMVIDGKEIGQVSLVGRVVEHEATANTAATAKSHGYKISDGSGIVTVRHWVDQTSGAQEEMIPVSSYLRVCGTVKMWQDKPVVTGSVRIMADNNEMSYHFLDAILTHLRLTQGPRDMPGQNSAGVLQPRSAAMGNQQQGQMGGQQMGQGGAGGGQKLTVNLAIKRAMQVGNRQLGMTIEDLARAVSSNGYSTAEVRTALRTMCQDGEVFSTDEVHYTW